MVDKQIIFLDLETTGLGPKAQILEIAMIAVDIEGGKIVETGEFQCFIDRGPVRDLWWQPDAYKIHKESGLVSRYEAGPRQGIYPGGLAGGFVDTHSAGRVPVMAGNSIHIDRTWLRGDLHFSRAFEPQFYHRMLDVSAFQSLADAAGIATPEKRMAHRALDDCRESIRLAQCWLDVLRDGMHINPLEGWVVKQ